jgi:hypothetical protein
VPQEQLHIAHDAAEQCQPQPQFQAHARWELQLLGEPQSEFVHLDRTA